MANVHLAAVAAVFVASSLGAQERITLPEAARRAVAADPAVAAVDALTRRAAAFEREAAAARFPAVTMQATATRFQEPMVVAPFHSFDPTRAPTFDATIVQSRVVGQYVLFDGGARSGRIDIARADAAGTRAAATAARLQTVEQLANAYLRVLTARNVRDAANRRVASLNAERDRVNLMVTSGRAARVELLRVDAALARAEAAQVAADLDEAVAIRETARWIGVDPSTLDPAAFVDLHLLPGPPPDRAALFARARSANPDVLNAETRVQAASAQLRAARADRLPALSLNAGYLTFGSAGGSFTGEWQAGVALSYPLFTGGARGRRADGARSRVEATSRQVEAVERSIQNAIDRAVGRITENETRVAAFARAEQHLMEVVRIERLALDTGRGAQPDFLRAEADLFETRSALAGARYALVSAHIALARITGDLSADWLAASLETRP